MSDLEYERDNKEITDRCCSLVLDYKAAEKKAKCDTKNETRLSIHDILEQRKLKDDFGLDCWTYL